MAEWTDEASAVMQGVGYVAHGEVALPTTRTAFGFSPFGGGPADAVVCTPENFLAAAAATCWLLTFAAVAEKMRFEVVETRATARVHVVPDGRGLKVESVTVIPVLRIRGEEVALADKVKRACEITSRGCVIEKAVTPGVAKYEVVPEITYVG